MLKQVPHKLKNVAGRMLMKKENPIAIQSKQWLLTALLCLMEKKDFCHISIKELTLYAGLDRKTFYRNFSSKEEVISMKLEELCFLYLQKLQTLPQFTAYTITQAYFEICYENKPFFMLLKQNNLLPLALIKFDEYLPKLNDIFLSYPYYRDKSEYELVYQAGGFWNTTIHWLNGGAKETPKEMAKIIAAIMPSPTH